MSRRTIENAMVVKIILLRQWCHLLTEQLTPQSRIFEREDRAVPRVNDVYSNLILRRLFETEI